MCWINKLTDKQREINSYFFPNFIIGGNSVGAYRSCSDEATCVLFFHPYLFCYNLCLNSSTYSTLKCWRKVVSCCVFIKLNKWDNSSCFCLLFKHDFWSQVSLKAILGFQHLKVFCHDCSDIFLKLSICHQNLLLYRLFTCTVQAHHLHVWNAALSVTVPLKSIHPS